MKITLHEYNNILLEYCNIFDNFLFIWNEQAKGDAITIDLVHLKSPLHLSTLKL